MEIIVSSRDENIKTGIKLHAEERAQEISTMYEKLTTCRVVLNKEKHEDTAEFILHGKNIDIEAKATGRSVYEAIDLAAGKLEKQLTKFLSKLHEHR